MLQERLTNLKVISTKYKLLDEIDMHDLIVEFAHNKFCQTEFF